MTTTGPQDQRHRDEGHDEEVLAPFFAAARRETPDPSLALLSAILADAGEVSAARAATAARPAGAAPPRPARRRLLAAFGGWRVAAAFTAAATVGFWVGLAGTVELSDAAPWTTSAELQADPVAGFFDLASAE